MLEFVGKGWRLAKLLPHRRPEAHQSKALLNRSERTANSIVVLLGWNAASLVKPTFKLPRERLRVSFIASVTIDFRHRFPKIHAIQLPCPFGIKRPLLFSWIKKPVNTIGWERPWNINHRDFALKCIIRHGVIIFTRQLLLSRIRLQRVYTKRYRNRNTGKEEYEFLHNAKFSQGDVVCTMIKCADGSLISLKLDTCLPRAYSREFTVSGTKGVVMEENNLILTEEKGFNHGLTMNEYRDTAKDYEDFLPQIWKDELDDTLKAGHGGMDALTLRAFFGAIISETEMPIDVYDATSWMAITCLSEASISQGGTPVDIPDFTSGKWIMREPKDVVEL